MGITLTGIQRTTEHKTKACIVLLLCLGSAYCFSIGLLMRGKGMGGKGGDMMGDDDDMGGDMEGDMPSKGDMGGDMEGDMPSKGDMGGDMEEMRGEDEMPSKGEEAEGDED